MLKNLMAIFVSCFAVSVSHAMGGEVGNGGQDVALEFATVGADVSNQLAQNFQAGAEACKNEIYRDLCSLNIVQFRKTLQLARVLSMPDLIQQDSETGRMLAYVALNYPQEQRILVSESEWTKPTFCYVKKLPLVLHEYLGLLGLEIQNYRYSSLLSEWLIQTAARDKFKGCLELTSQGEGK